MLFTLAQDIGVLAEVMDALKPELNSVAYW